MKFTLEIEAEDFTSARALLITALGSGEGNDAPSATAGSGSSGSADGASSGTANRKAAGQKAREEAPSGGSESQFTYEVVSAKVQEVSKLKGREVAINLLGQFKQEDGSPATKGAQLQPKDYDDFMEKAAAALDDIG